MIQKLQDSNFYELCYLCKYSVNTLHMELQYEVSTFLLKLT